MKFEKSCGAVVYRKNGKYIEFLIVKSRTHNHWGFPKGHIEKGESEEATAKREVLEETGLEISIHCGFRKSIEYFLTEGINKEVIYFVGIPLNEKVNIQQEEIQEYRWGVYSKILEILTFDSDRKVLTEANKLKVDKF